MGLFYQTIVIMGATVFFMCGLAFWGLSRVQSLQHGLGYWTISSFCAAAGFFSFLIFHQLDLHNLAEAGFSLLMFGWGASFIQGTWRWLNTTGYPIEFYGVTFFAAAWITYFNFVKPDFLMALAMSSIYCSVAHLSFAYLIWPHAKKSIGMKLLFAGAILSAMQWLAYPFIRLEVTWALYGFLAIVLLALICNQILCMVSIWRLTKFLISSEEQAKSLATHDKLTGLNNRLGLDEQFNMVTEAHPNQRITALYLDLNDFKPINDKYGHKAGDYVLKVVSKRILHNIRKVDVAARIGGDEFVILLCQNGSIDPDIIELIVHRLHADIQHNIYYKDKQLNVSTSVGIAVYPQDGNTLPELLSVADKSMYRHKAFRKQSKKHKPQPAPVQAIDPNLLPAF